MIEFRRYKKIAPTWARLLTQRDYEERRGLVQAPEGLLKFTPGDFLAKDAKGEWVLWQSTVKESYRRVSEENPEGFAHYIRIDTSLAAQMPEPFVIDGMRGEAGDYLVINAGASWPVNCEIFQRTYVLAETNETPGEEKEALEGQ